MEKWKKTGTFDILNNISEYVTLVKLMDLLGNANHAVSVVGEWIFDSNVQKGLAIEYLSIEFNL